MKARFYGRLWYKDNRWKITADPQVMLRLKRIFEGISKSVGEAELGDRPETCCDLLWFLERYPLEITTADRERLKMGSIAFNERIRRLEEYLDPSYQPPAFEMAEPPRDYQRRAAAVYLSQSSLLLADDVGLGKTATSICSFTDPRTLPAVVVCYPSLQTQWLREINRFMPKLNVHIIKKKTPYELPKFMGRGSDVIIISYAKLSDWAEVLASYCNSIVFDEVQELRHDTSQKYRAAAGICRKMSFRIGLSATPVYNYGGEIFNVLNVLSPDCLGDRHEFYREWCNGWNNKIQIKDPRAFGAYLRESGLMLRRTREEVGRELPAVQRITHEVECDTRRLDEIKGKATELAKIILSRAVGERGEKMQAGGELDNMLRQATGLAKAPYVAEFVRMLVENGERVVLVGWHHAVYEIWKSRLSDLRLVTYNGTDSPAAKDKAKAAFMAGEVDVMLLSLRSGVGLDGLQSCCRTIVFGELDWSPGVHEQCIGRVSRDGQTRGVMAYFLVADHGADPVMCQVLGLKREQVEGIRNPDGEFVERLVRSDDHIQKLAQTYLEKAA